jgi:ribonuclease III
MVNTNTLAQLSEELGIGEYLYLGRGILKGGGRGLRSLLANAFESVLGAVFLDAGYDVAYHFYLGRFRQLSQPVQDENFKGRLQQVVQDRYSQTPVYDSAAARGPNNRREYTAVVYAGSEPLGTGHGTTKQQAEQEAAKAALTALEGPADEKRKPARRSRRRTPKAAAPGEEIPEVAAEEAPTGAI